MRKIVYYVLILLMLSSSACQRQNKFKADKVQSGYAAHIDTTEKITYDTIPNSKKPIHKRIEKFNDKMNKKNNAIGYGYSYVTWIFIIGAIVVGAWLAVNGVI